MGVARETGVTDVTYGPLLRQRATAAWVADLSERIDALDRDLESLAVTFGSWFPRRQPLSPQWIGWQISHLPQACSRAGDAR